jgi:hypothetical protein
MWRLAHHGGDVSVSFRLRDFFDLSHTATSTSREQLTAVMTTSRDAWDFTSRDSKCHGKK